MWAHRAAVVLAACASYAGCATSNGDPIAAPDSAAPGLDAGGPPRPIGNDSSAPPGDGGDASAPDAKGDADAGFDPSSVRINEIFVNTGTSGGDKIEFVELRGAPGTPIGELTLRILDTTGAVSGEMNVAASPSDTIKPSGYYVIGGALAITIDADAGVDNVMIGSALNYWGLKDPRGAVQLVRGTARTLVDVVGWDSEPDAGALPPPAVPPTQTMEGKPAVLPSGTKSLGRSDGAVDTNDNRADFCAMAPTAGRAQAACE